MCDGACSEDDPSQLNGSESQERRTDSHRSRSKESGKASRSREVDPEKAARDSRSADAALMRSLTRDRVRPSDSDVGDDRVWSPQQEEVVHEKVRVKEEGSTRERRSKHRLDEAVLKVLFILSEYTVLFTSFLSLSSQNPVQCIKCLVEMHKLNDYYYHFPAIIQDNLH